jgi:hypothetical protein
MRSGLQPLVLSKGMAWIAFDRAAKEVVEGAYDEPEERWREIAKRRAARLMCMC